MPPNVLLPVHILYHDRLHEQPLKNQLQKLAREWQSDDSPIRLSIIRMGVVLDAPSEPLKLVAKLTGERHFRVDFRGAFAGVLADYKLLTTNGQNELFEPEILIFLSSLPISEGDWLKVWQSILGEYRAKAGAYWINQSPLDPNQKKDIDAELSRFFPKVKTLGHSIIVPPASKDIEFLVSQKLPLLKKRLDEKLVKLKERQSQSSPKINNRPSANPQESVKPPSAPAKPIVPSEHQPPPPVTQNITPIQKVESGRTDVEAAKPNIAKDVTATLEAGKKPEASNGAFISEKKQTASDSKPQESVDEHPSGQNAEQIGQEDAGMENKLTAGIQSNEGTEVKAAQPIQTKASQPAQWQVKEPPAELGDRVAHIFTDDRSGPRGWYMVGASRRGKMHENDGTFREDAFKIEVDGGWLLAAVADGAGSHHLSRVGSDLATKAAIKVMQETVQKYDPIKPTAKDALVEALKSAWEALRKETEKRKADNVSFRDFSTTLLLLMYHPGKNLVGIAQVGDGLIAAQLNDGSIVVLGEAESGEYSGQTYFLTNHKYEELESKVKVIESSSLFKMFFVMTDGVADDLYPPQERLPGLIKPMPSIIAATDPKKALLELINYDRSGSFDDRTLVIACQPEKITVLSQAAAQESAKDAVDAPPLASAPENEPGRMSAQPDQVVDDSSIEKSSKLDANPDEA